MIGAMRVMAADRVPNCLSDCIKLDAGPDQFDPVEGVVDVGITKTGFKVSWKATRVDGAVKYPAGLVTITFHEVQPMFLYETLESFPNLILLRQDYQTKVIAGVSFKDVEANEFEIGISRFFEIAIVTLKHQGGDEIR